MEHTPLHPPTHHTTNSGPSASLATTILVSVLIGGLAGAGVGYGVVTSHWSNSGSTTINGKTTTIAVQEESGTVDVVAKSSPAVVSIVITKDYSKYFQNTPVSPLDNFFFGLPSQDQTQPQGKQEIGGGTGFIVQSNGLIVTNKHVVEDDQAEYSVVLNDGKKYDAKVLAKDPVNDVALLKVDASNLPTLSLGNSDSVRIGQTVVAIGNALGQYRNTVTKGIISGKSRTITANDQTGQSETLEDVFQTDAAINPGNSGGPLLDLSGHVIAINTAVNSQGQLIGFALPINIVKKDVTSVQATGKITSPYLGVRYVVITKSLADQNKLPLDHGALVERGNNQDAVAVVPGSPADKVGIVENDIILSLNGNDITPDHSLAGLLAAYKPGDTVTLKVYHMGDQKDVKVVLGDRQ